MRPYNNIRLTERPDLADIRAEGRRSSVGKIPRGEVYSRFVDNIVQHTDGTPGRIISKVVRNEHSNFRNTAAKRATRRALKKANRNRGEDKLNDE